MKTIRSHCEHCNQPVEFDREHIGTIIDCPNCNQKTKLVKEKKQIPMQTILLLSLILNSIAVAGLFYALIGANRKLNTIGSELAAVNSSLDKVESSLNYARPDLSGITSRLDKISSGLTGTGRRSLARRSSDNILDALKDIDTSLAR